MNLYLVGLNHRTAPLDLREQLAFSPEGVATALLLFRNQFPDTEAAILSTCNRVEMLVAANSARPTLQQMCSFLAEARDLPVNNFRPHLYQLSNEQAVRHLFRVASGLDSMVVGEYQIVSQLKQAYAQASEQGTTGRMLNRLFHQAFAVGKRVRSETEIGRRKVSVPSVAVEIAHQVFAGLADKRTLVIGAGEMAQLVCQYLHKADAREFTVTSRTASNARTLAHAFNARAVEMDQLDEELVAADIVVAATRCPRPILTYERVKAAQARRHGRPLFILDLAVPRNVEPSADTIGQVFVYDIDALGKIVADNQTHRQNQLAQCEQILDQELLAFEKWRCDQHAQPLIEQMYNDAGELRELELARFFAAQRDLSEEQRDAVRQLVDRLTNKLLHPCATTLRQHSRSETGNTLAQSLRDLIARQRR